ncbi:MAG: hypothetical protein JNL82_16045 [Myxococcales bacterium]|nr:hypothetical protein [Myxococcales bacterium]
MAVVLDFLENEYKISFVNRMLDLSPADAATALMTWRVFYQLSWMALFLGAIQSVAPLVGSRGTVLVLRVVGCLAVGVIPFLALEGFEAIPFVWVVLFHVSSIAAFVHLARVEAKGQPGPE